MAYRTPLEQDLDRIRTLLLQMCVRGEGMVRQAVRSIMAREPELARNVVATDREVDRLEKEVDRLCLRCLALHQPTGADLRLVTAAMKMVTDLERIGDQAVNVAERGFDLLGVGVEPQADIPQMAELVGDMLRTAADAFVARDAALARSLASRDDEVDRLNRQAFEHWMRAMSDHPDQVQRALALTSIAKSLERIGDHAVNVGQMVVFLVEGEDLRHP